MNYESYNKGIVLFDGKTSKLGENPLKSSMDKDIIDDNVSFQVIFSGKTTELDEEDMFTISLISSAIKNPETAQNLKLLQIEESSMNSIDSNQEYRNSIR